MKEVSDDGLDDEVLDWHVFLSDLLDTFYACRVTHLVANYLPLTSVWEVPAAGGPLLYREGLRKCHYVLLRICNGVPFDHLFT